jgi:cytochrome c oxidase subunit 1/cytochrome c oxidase subunit I+III
VPIDYVLNDTYWVVSHIHYVLFGGSVFGVFAGVYYWFPKMTGKMLDETIGKWHFWLLLLGFGVWVHHMFATGLPPVSLSFFSAASFAIVIPSAVAVFSWLATIWTGRPVFKTPFLFFAGFVLLFVIGGLSGFMTASVPVDRQLTDTYFVVGHLHYVIIGINVFAVVGGTYYWFPKMTGRMMSERLGRWNFWVMFVGFNVGFFPMHIAGLLGMPRRIYSYPSGMGWDGVNAVISWGAYLFAFGVLLFLVNIVRSLRHGAPAGPNPWDAATLEWSTSSPPPPYNVAVIPTVGSRSPLWEDRLADVRTPSRIDRGMLLDHGRETIGTTALDAEPDVILRMPGDSPAPLLLTLALTGLFAAALLHRWIAVGVCAALTLLAMVVWLWPETELGQTAEFAHDGS